MIVAIVILFIMVIILTVAVVKMYNLFCEELTDLWIYKEDNEQAKKNKFDHPERRGK